MAFPSVNILKHAMSMYTVEAFLMFEKEFRHILTFNRDEGVIECTCKMFPEGIKDGQTLDLGTSNGKDHVGCSSIWKMQMMGKMTSIITSSQMNKNARAHCEKYFMELKEVIEFDVSSIHFDEDGQGKDLNSLPKVLNPPGSHQKGVRNKRFKSIVEKKCDQVKWRKPKKLSKTDVGSSTAPPQISLPTFNLSSSVPYVQHLVGEGSFLLLYFHSSYYSHPLKSSIVFMPITTLPVLQQFHTNKFLADATHNDEH
ncbi:hypothetical protein Cgig2_014872 [Carnegiea gigantea]|uniref:Uncharacterized protein n=1 Tax=Carnegiea gigantea TaxID=171969 RepID=A0A9Q1L0K1_9CARY|nr:hypothetical protein Cgig2_014872 [Carnegiea gigantea]